MDGRLGPCEMCTSMPAKYTCPGCEINTCSVSCVKEHKSVYECDGKRKKTLYKPLSKFTDLDFQSDYGLLEEIANTVNSCSRGSQSKIDGPPADIPKVLRFLREAAHKRNMKLWFMPKGFSRRKLNQSFFNIPKQTIEWTVHCCVYSSDDQPQTLLLKQSKVSEKTPLGECIKSLLSSSQEEWIVKMLDDLQDMTILLQAENIKAAQKKFFKLDYEKSIEENLKGHTLVEFPFFHLVQNSCLDKFQTLTLEQAEVEKKELIEKIKRMREELANEQNAGDDSETSQSTKRACLDEPPAKMDVVESEDEVDCDGNFFNL